MHKTIFMKPPSSRGPCCSAEVGSAGVSAFSSPRGPEFPENFLPTGSEAKRAGKFQPGGGLAYASCQWRGQVSCDLAPRMLSLSSLTCFHKPHTSFVSHLTGFGDLSVC